MNQTPAQPEATPEEKRRDQIANAMRRLAAKYPGRNVESVHVVSILRSTDSEHVSDAEFRAEARAALAALDLVLREAGDQR
ncbi:hypothetical protein ACQEVC_45690 [Plantactinospora sp. CA-294935]|uniref:hypothetical protein n=1 Tax=Plantactinospora sp. CA-294935 TaxID=3240012 RepID=UPI003D949A2F